MTDEAGTVKTDATFIGNVNPFRYRGYYYDEESGLYYLQSRYYDPETGRFVKADGVFDKGAGIDMTNLYAYCGNDPVNKFDPTGMCAQDYYVYLGFGLNTLNCPSKNTATAATGRYAGSTSSGAIPKSDEWKPRSAAESARLTMSQSEKVALAVIMAEEGSSSVRHTDAVAWTIRNRLTIPAQHVPWQNATSLMDIVADRSQYNAYEGNAAYFTAVNYMNGMAWDNSNTNDKITSALAILRGYKTIDFTDGAVFALRGPWKYENDYQEVFPSGDWGNFRLFKLK